MRIGIDARCLEWQEGGPSRYLVNMLKLWPTLRTNHKYVLFFQNRIPDLDCLKNNLFESVLIKGPKLLKRRRIVGEQVLMPFSIKKHKIDLYFTPWYSAPLIKTCEKIVVACWDVACISHPSYSCMTDRISFGFFSPRSCRKADGLITCSNFDASQIKKYYKTPADKLCVVHMAADDNYKPADDSVDFDTFRKKYNLPKRYILSLGIILKKRNVDVLINAFKKIYRDYSDVALVVSGRDLTVPYADIKAMMKPLMDEGRGLYLLRVPEEDMVNMYRAAWYFVCTSTTDGETLMLKESMKCGTPIITSPLLEDTMGGNALIINDPTSTEETAGILRKALSEVHLRDEYAAKGMKFAQSLSWNDVAETSIKFMESC